MTHPILEPNATRLFPGRDNHDGGDSGRRPSGRSRSNADKKKKIPCSPGRQRPQTASGISRDHKKTRRAATYVREAARPLEDDDDEEERRSPPKEAKSPAPPKTKDKQVYLLKIIASGVLIQQSNYIIEATALNDNGINSNKEDNWAGDTVKERDEARKTSDKAVTEAAADQGKEEEIKEKNERTMKDITNNSIQHEDKNKNNMKTDPTATKKYCHKQQDQTSTHYQQEIANSKFHPISARKRKFGKQFQQKIKSRDILLIFLSASRPEKPDSDVRKEADEPLRIVGKGS